MTIRGVLPHRDLALVLTLFVVLSAPYLVRQFAHVKFGFKPTCACVDHRYSATSLDAFAETSDGFGTLCLGQMPCPFGRGGLSLCVNGYRVVQSHPCLLDEFQRVLGFFLALVIVKSLGEEVHSDL